MAKTRAQRKAERRKRQQQQQRQQQQRRGESRAQLRTQVPESADVVEAELAEAGADLETLKRERVEDVPEQAPDRALEPPVEAEPPVPEAPAPSRADVGRATELEEAAPGWLARRRAERERRRRAKEQARRRQAAAEPQERARGAVVGFLLSCWAELKRVQWPNRETLIQASAVTLIFIAIAAAYLGALDAAFNFLVKRIL